MKKIRILDLKNGSKEMLQNGDLMVEQRDGETLVLNCNTGIWKVDCCYNDLFAMDENEEGVVDIYTTTPIYNQLVKDGLMETDEEEEKNEEFRLLILETSEKCNLGCKYCFENANTKGKNMSKQMALKAFRKFISLEGCANSICVEFNGGEALLNFKMIKEVVPEILRIAGETGVEVRFTTQNNGTLLTEEMVDFFKEYKFSVGISLDGTEDYNKERVYPDGRSTFDDVIKGIRLLREKKIPYSTLSVIHREGQFSNIVDLLSYTGCKEFRANLISSIGRGKDGMKENTDEIKQIAKEYVTFCKNLLKEKQYYEANTMYYFLSLMLMHPFMCYKEPCGAGMNQLFVDPNGDIFICQESCFIKKGYVGNIELDKECIIENIKKNDWFQKIQGRKTALIEECKDCPWKKFCRSCPCRVYDECGELFCKSPLCEFYKYVFREFIWIIHNDTEAVMDFLQFGF